MKKLLLYLVMLPLLAACEKDDSTGLATVETVTLDLSFDLGGYSTRSFFNDVRELEAIESYIDHNLIIKIKSKLPLHHCPPEGFQTPDGQKRVCPG